MKRILIIEDEDTVREELKIFLGNNGFEVTAPRYILTETQICAEKPDLILLDIGLGKENGILLCQRVRKQLDVPIIFVTSQETVQSEIQGFQAGGDDYIRKPYHLPILLLRIQKLLERGQEKLVVDGVTLDLVFGQLTDGQEVFELSKKEQQILYYLFKSHPRVVGRDELIEYLWENKFFVDENILNVNLSRIRKRLEGTSLADFVRTVPRRGYVVGKSSSA